MVGECECREPSEKESGVRFIIDIIFVERVGWVDRRGGDVSERGVNGEIGVDEAGRLERCASYETPGVEG